MSEGTGSLLDLSGGLQTRPNRTQRQGSFQNVYSRLLQNAVFKTQGNAMLAYTPYHSIKLIHTKREEKTCGSAFNKTHGRPLPGAVQLMDLTCHRPDPYHCLPTPGGGVRAGLSNGMAGPPASQTPANEAYITRPSPSIGTLCPPPLLTNVSQEVTQKDPLRSHYSSDGPALPQGL